MKKTAALRYHPFKNKVPQVVPSEEGLLVEKILAVAKESEFPFSKHKDLAEALFAVPFGGEIPRDIYELIAQLLAFVLELDGQKHDGVKKSELEF